MDYCEKYLPSEPCSCAICLAYCKRPGWWTVQEAAMAIEAGYGGRMMLEIAPELTFGVLSPAFAGCEAGFANKLSETNGCCFLKNELCELHGTGFQPLECRFCHHDRQGLGKQCHSALEKDWDSLEGKALIVRWSKLTGFWEKYNIARK